MVLNKHRTLFGNCWQENIQSRMNILVSVFFSLFPFLIMVVLFRSLSVFNSDLSIDFSYVVNYYFLAAFINVFTRPEVHWGLARKIGSGEFIDNLVKPISPTSEAFSRELANKTFRIITILPVFIFLMISFRDVLFIRIDLELIPLFLTSLSLAFLTGFFYSYSLGIITFWLWETYAFSSIEHTFLLILSGGILPLSFLPNFLVNIIDVLPFKHFLFFPVQVLQGLVSADKLKEEILLQLIWLIIFFSLWKYLNKKGIKYCLLNGG